VRGNMPRALTLPRRLSARASLLKGWRFVPSRSLEAFCSEAVIKIRRTGRDASIRGADILRRAKEPRGPLVMFGCDCLSDHATSEGVATPRLLSFAGSWGAGEEYAYEALNFADGRHTVQQIADELSAVTAPSRRSSWPSVCRR
jgi:hypothetical protein